MSEVLLHDWSSSDDSQLSSLRADVATIAVFVLLTGYCTLGLLVVNRGDLGSPFALILAVSGLLTFATTAPFALPLTMWRRPVLGVTLPILVVILAYFSPVGFLVLDLRVCWSCWVLAIPGLWGLGRTLWGCVNRSMLLAWATAPILALHLYFEVQSRGYAHAFTPEFAEMGLLNQDTYFLTAVSHLIQQTLEPTIGADGLVPLHYHVASHYWFAGLAHMSGSTPLWSYTLGQVGAAVPVMFATLFIGARLISGPKVSVVALIIAGVFLAGLFDGVGLTSYYVSESYTVGLMVLLAAVPLLCRIAQLPPLRARSHLGVVAISCALVLMASASKISVGLILGAAFAWLLFRRFGFRLINLVGLAALGGVLLVALSSFNSATIRLEDAFSPMSFYLTYMPNITLTSLVLPVGLLVVVARRRSWLDSDLSPPSRRLLVEGLVVSLVVALLPSLLLYIPGGSAWYFQNVPHWLVLSFVLPLAVVGVKATSFWPQGQTRIVAALLLVILVRGTVGSILVSSSLEQQLEVPSSATPSYGARLTHLVEAFRGRHPEALAVYVPPVNEAFWSFPNECISRTHLIPSLTGVLLLFGLPPLGDTCFLEARGYLDYGDESRSRPIHREALCQHARARGIDWVLVMRDVNDESANSELDCRSMP